MAPVAAPFVQQSFSAQPMALVLSQMGDPTFRALLLSTHPTELFSLVNHFTS